MLNRFPAAVVTTPSHFGISSVDSQGARIVTLSVDRVGGRTWVVNPDAPTGSFATISEAVAAASSGDRILVAEGAYDETVSVPRTKHDLEIVGMGPRGSVAIAPSSTNPVVFTNNATGTTLRNIGLATTGTGNALVNTGSQLSLYGCKIEGNGDNNTLVALTLNTVAEHDASPRLKGNGADLLIEGCEFAWSAGTGILLTGTDYGAVTEVYIRDCRFHNITGKHITESVGSGGAAAVTFANLSIERCVFMRDESAAQPTAYIDLNADNANSGVVTQCAFPTAINGGKNTVSTALLWVANYHTGGVSTTQPS